MSPLMMKIQVIIIVITTGFLLAALYVYLRAYRRTHTDPKYVPTRFLKSRWRSWGVRPSYGRMGRHHDGPPSHDLQTSDTSYNPSLTITDTNSRPPTEAAIPVNGVDRNTSVRSVITLPAYNASPDPSERLIAREGERAGIDTVVEFPETADEEERRREEDMESLYQIRQARRREIDEREERRRERQLARDTGDWARVEQLRLESQMRARVRADSVGSVAGSLTPPATVGSSTLIAEHNARTGSRERRVSSVSYADLGLARHDGSRLRADSVESSDQRPLLDSAASMGGREDRSRRNSLALAQPLAQHRRNLSGESDRSHADASADDDTPRTSMAGDRGGASTGRSSFPPTDPPRYEQLIGYTDEDAPPYSSPVTRHNNHNLAHDHDDDDDDDLNDHDNGNNNDRPPRLPMISGFGVPAIEVTGTTPANSVPATPVDGFGEGDVRREGERGRR